MRHRPSHASSLQIIVGLLIALSLSLLSACGAKQGPSDLSAMLPDHSASADVDFEGAYLSVTDDGRILVARADRDLQKARFFRVIPARWHEDLGPEPTLATGVLIHEREQTLALIIAQNPNADIDGARVRAAEALTPLTAHKAVAHITGIDNPVQDEDDDANNAPTEVTINLGRETGMARGDWFYAISDAPLDKKQPRFGDQVTALLRVIHVSENQSTAEVIHSTRPISEDQALIFAQHTAPASSSPINILVAPFSQNSQDDETVLAPIVKALPSLGATYRISNTSIDTLPTFIDPRPWDAAYTAEDAAPDTGWGVTVFGDIEGNNFIYNAVGYGNVPSPSGWVGILPGGLSLPFEEDVSELAHQIALSYLSNGLGMRGDHAQAVYMLETELRRDDIQLRMRYHLHEHLALRYAAMGRLDEAMRIMHYDLLDARAQDDVYAQLNALSIRAYLDREAGLDEQILIDGKGFLTLADGVLPDFALDGERLGYARGLLETGQFNEAEKLISTVINSAVARGDYRIHLHAVTLLTRIQVQREQLETALLVFDSLEDDIEDYSTETRVSLRMLRAELLAQIEDYPTSLNMLFQAFEELEEISLAGQASALQRAAGIMMAISQPLQATRAILDAAEIYQKLSLVPEAASMLALGAHLRLGLADQLPPQQANEMLIDALQEFQRAATMYRALGNNSDAAEATFYVAVLNGRFDNTGARDPFYAVAKQLYLQLGDFESLAQVTLFQQHIAMATGQAELAQSLSKEAKKWISIGEIDVPSEVTEEPADLENQELPLTSPDEP